MWDEDRGRMQMHGRQGMNEPLLDREEKRTEQMFDGGMKRFTQSEIEAQVRQEEYEQTQFIAGEIRDIREMQQDLGEQVVADQDQLDEMSSHVEKAEANVDHAGADLIKAAELDEDTKRKKRCI